jgi:hypothetical protein
MLVKALANPPLPPMFNPDMALRAFAGFNRSNAVPLLLGTVRPWAPLEMDLAMLEKSGKAII